MVSSPSKLIHLLISFTDLLQIKVTRPKSQLSSLNSLVLTFFHPSGKPQRFSLYGFKMGRKGMITFEFYKYQAWYL